MRKFISLSMVLALLLALSATTVLAGGQGAAKEVQFKNSFGNCDIGATSGTETDSFAIINFPDDKVSAQIKINKLDPDTTYQVRLVQTPNGLGGNCGAIDGELTTNRQGNGTLHLSESRDATTTGAFVLLQGGTMGFLATDGVNDL